MEPTTPATIVIDCETCRSQHTAHYSHDSQYGGHRVYAAVCTQDNLTDYYTAEAGR